MTSHRILRVAALSGGLAVALGAFGAHGLRDAVPAGDLDIWETAVGYHAWHALALLACGLIAPARRLVLAAWCFGLGSLVFSGTLYALVLSGARWLGAITPIGGVLLIAGWLVLATVRKT